MVVREFSSGVGEIALTAFQKRLAQNYFIALDAELKKAEIKRLKKIGKYRDPLPVVWANVNMEGLAQNVVAAARIGLDPALDNHVAMMPFKNNALNKYDIVFIDGYRGLEIKAKKYGLDVPDAVIVELVYENDRFVPHKKDAKNPVESYEFVIVNPFDRGGIVGGFYYHVFRDAPEKNRLVMMTYADILKRKPKYAPMEFWGGERDVWEDDEATGRRKKVGTEHEEGWHEFMCWKTLRRAAYRAITIDSQKIDDDYIRLRQAEADFDAAEAEREAAENANRETIDIAAEVVEVVPETPGPAPAAETPRADAPAASPAQAPPAPAAPGARPAGGPGF